MTATISASLGAGLVLAKPGGSRLLLLNPTATWLWQAQRIGLSVAEMARALAEQSGVKVETLTTDVMWLVAQWQGDGWLAPQVLGAIPPAPPALPAIAPPICWPLSAPVQSLRLGDTHIRLRIDDAGLARWLDDFTSPLTHHPSTTSAPGVHVEGDADAWQVLINGARNADGRGWEAALIATLNALIEVASRAEERLLVVHGAGLALPDGRGLLLVAPGGSGKTTLAAALNAEGLTFLNDDVVPVNWDGSLVGLKIPICLKPGSWPVLASRRPELAGMPEMARFGQQVRYLPPRGDGVASARAPVLLLFPQYQPDATSRLQPLDPAAALQALVEAEAIIRGLTQPKLERLVQWIGAAPAFALSYPDLESGLDLVKAAISVATSGSGNAELRPV
ncbi:MAG: PqqD family peptide modification chaperone [Chromatiaceae bacterium]